MAEERKLTAEEAGIVVAFAGLPEAPERRRHLARILPGFRQRCDRLLAVDVADVEFDFLRPLR